MKISLLITRQKTGSGEVWVAQCLEHDICVQSHTLSGLEKRFEETFSENLLLAYHFSEDTLSNIPKAPKRFWDSFETAYPINLFQPGKSFLSVETRINDFSESR